MNKTKTNRRKTKTPDISIVIPAHNEQENVLPLYQELHHALSKIHLAYEIIFVNDGSTDNTQKELEELYTHNKNTVRVIHYAFHVGKASALKSGFMLACGNIIITLDADLQDDPKEIPRFLHEMEKGYGLVTGWKQQRKDTFIKNSTSKVFNTITGIVTGVKLHDMNCGYKAYKAEFAKGIKLYGELHRYIPVFAHYQGYTIAEIPVHHRKRLHGTSKYGPIRFINGFIDLITVLYLTKYRLRPLHLFGYIGISVFTMGFLIALYLTMIKLAFHQSIGTRPLLLFSAVLMIFGMQIGVVGLIGEQLATLTQQKNDTTVHVDILN